MVYRGIMYYKKIFGKVRLGKVGSGVNAAILSIAIIRSEYLLCNFLYACSHETRNPKAPSLNNIELSFFVSHSLSGQVDNRDFQQAR